MLGRRVAVAQSVLPSPADYSGHSRRGGFAAWADANGWYIKTLMEYVGWKDVKSAMRYLDGADPFARHRIEASLSPQITSSLVLPAPGSAPPLQSGGDSSRSEEHTSELQSLMRISYAVFCLKNTPIHTPRQSSDIQSSTP